MCKEGAKILIERPPPPQPGIEIPGFGCPLAPLPCLPPSPRERLAGDESATEVSLDSRPLRRPDRRPRRVGVQEEREGGGSAQKDPRHHRLRQRRQGRPLV